MRYELIKNCAHFTCKSLMSDLRCSFFAHFDGQLGLA